MNRCLLGYQCEEMILKCVVQVPFETSYDLQSKCVKNAPFKGICIFIFILFIFSVALCDMWNFPEQGLNLGPLHWKCVVLTIGPSGKSRDSCCLVSFLEIMLGKPALRNVIFKQIYRRVLILEHLRLKILLTPNSIPVPSRKRSRTPARALRCQKSP